MRFATKADYRECEAIHRRHGSTYYFATKRFPSEVRMRVHALYGFVRVPDEWVDNPQGLSLEERRKRLADWRNQFLLGLEGVEPASGVMRAFVDSCQESGMAADEPLAFLNAMEMDLAVSEYRDYEALRGYMRGSAAAVGLMMLDLLGEPRDGAKTRAAIALGEAMQMTNFLRDVSEDVGRGRVYLPEDDMAQFGVSREQIEGRKFSDRFRELLKFEAQRTRGLYRQADDGIRMLSPAVQGAVLLARVLYSDILLEIEKRDWNVFAGRARTSKLHKLKTAFRVWRYGTRVLDVYSVDDPVATKNVTAGKV